VIVAKQPSPVIADLARDERFHLLAVPMTPELEKIYAPAMLSSFACMASGLEVLRTALRRSVSTRSIVVMSAGTTIALVRTSPSL